jgi:predicted RNase H-like nuclease (RuvC/YqgF family)
MSLQWKAVCAACVMGMTMAAAVTAQVSVPVRVGKRGAQPVTHPHANQQNGSCKELLAQSRELMAQEKQLHEQGKALLGEEKSFNKQAEAVEAQRVAMEHSMRSGLSHSGTEAQLKQMEQQRVSLERQGVEKSKEREQIERQADEINKQRVELERQHNEQCGGHHKIKPVTN